MARTPDIEVKGKKKKQITAFIVDTKAPGFEILHRCRFMGIRAIQNGVIRVQGPEGAQGQHHPGPGQGPQAGPGDPQHRAPDPAGGFGRQRQALRGHVAALGRAPRAVGSAHRRARRRGPEDRRDGRQHPGHGSRHLVRLGPGRQGRGGHPHRSRHGQALLQRVGLEDRGRDPADTRRPRLRDRKKPARARRGQLPHRAHDARQPHQPHHRGGQRDHAPLHRPRGPGPPPAHGRRPGEPQGRQGFWRPGLHRPQGRRLLRHVVPRPLDPARPARLVLRLRPPGQAHGLGGQDRRQSWPATFST